MRTRGTTFNPGQLSRLQADITIAVGTILSKVVEDLGDPKGVMKALDNKRAILGRNLEGRLKEAIISASLLLPVRQGISLELPRDYTPKAFFEDGKLVSLRDPDEGLVHGMILHADAFVNGTEFKVDISEIRLDEYGTPDRIHEGLPDNPKFDESTALAICASLIAAQAKGQSGYLSLEHSNLIYVRYAEYGSYELSMFYEGKERKWRLIVSRNDGKWWGKGVRVISPAR